MQRAWFNSQNQKIKIKSGGHMHTGSLPVQCPHCIACFLLSNKNLEGTEHEGQKRLSLSGANTFFFSVCMCFPQMLTLCVTINPDMTTPLDWETLSRLAEHAPMCDFVGHGCRDLGTPHSLSASSSSLALFPGSAFAPPRTKKPSSSLPFCSNSTALVAPDHRLNLLKP